MITGETDTVRYTNLGRTGLQISVIGLGCGNFGGIGSMPEFFGKGDTEEEALANIADAIREYLDTDFPPDEEGGQIREIEVKGWFEEPCTK